MKIIAAFLIIIGLLVAVGSYYFISKDASIVYTAPSNNSNSQINSVTNQSQPTSSTPQTYSIKIQNFAFVPGTMNIKQGDTIIWTNQDSTAHTVTSDSGSELASSTLSSGQTYSHTFNQKGTFAYHCSIHTSMKGSVIVN